MVALLAMLCLFAVSCTKDEPKNMECDILSAWVEGAQYEQYFYQKADMRCNDIASTETEIVFWVQSVSALPQMPVQFSITEGATISPASGSLQDFAAGPVAYTVTSEDGEYSRRYKVTFMEQRVISDQATLYSFEHVVDSVNSIYNATYNVFYELGAAGVRDYILASGNAGVAMVHSDFTPEQYPTSSTASGYQGKGVCLKTIDAGVLGRMIHKPIAAGNLYIGSFDAGQVLSNPLKCTVFGIPVNKQPVKVTGYYKYQPGAEYTNANMDVVQGRTDEANIYAVFFRNQNSAGERVNLYGDNVLTSPYVVSRAQVASLPATSEWTPFEMTFDEGAVDPEVLAAFGYSMTLVFSSSKGGDNFEGAIGSTLYVDEVEVTYNISKAAR